MSIEPVDRLEQSPPPLRLGISGLGGWLVLIQIGLYLTLLQLVVQIIQYSIPAFESETWVTLTTKGSEFYHALWKPTIIIEGAINVGMVLFTVFCLITMYRRKRLFPRLMIIFYSVSLLIGLLDYALIRTISSDLGLDLDNSLRDTVRAVVTCAIWIPYFRRSERVFNTFTLP